MKLRVGDAFPIQTVRTVAGDTVTIPAPTRLVHVQFRRWVGCPICNTHVGQLIKRADEIGAAGVREVLFFHSHAADMTAFQEDVPFDLVADPTKEHYKLVGAETSLWYWLSLKTVRAALRGLTRGKFTFKMTSGPFGLPADFLVDHTGRIVAAKYGRSASDQWSVDELLTLARAARRPAAAVAPPIPVAAG